MDEGANLKRKLPACGLTVKHAGKQQANLLECVFRIHLEEILRICHEGRRRAHVHICLLTGVQQVLFLGWFNLVNDDELVKAVHLYVHNTIVESNHSSGSYEVLESWKSWPPFLFTLPTRVPAESVSSSESEEQGARKYAKRGRAPRRRTTDIEKAFLFAHALAPKFVQALAKTFQAGWIFNGTPESGIAAAACVEIGVQKVALCKNDTH